MKTIKFTSIILLNLCHLILVQGCYFGENETKSIDLNNKAVESYNYCLEKDLNTDLCILIDMKIHSGKFRFFVWSFKGDSILNQGLCSHGCCKGPWGSDDTKQNPRFSNVQNSHC